jgi:hypothetical protein
MARIGSSTTAPAEPLTPRDRLDAAWTELDRAFGPRSNRIGPLPACDDCFTAEEMDVLGGPVDEIPEQLLCYTVMSWSTTFEVSIPHWRRYAPRLLRGIVEQTLAIDESWVARNFALSAWKQWPDDERRAVQELCEAWWAVTLASAGDLTAAVVLAFLVALTGELTPWLDVWSRTEGENADLHLLDLWETWGYRLLEGNLDVSFSGEVPDISAELSAWLLAELPRRSLVDGLYEPDADRFLLLALPPDQRWR